MEKVKQEFGRLFLELPETIMEQALGSGGGKGSAWNRAARRRHAGCWEEREEVQLR